MNRLLAGLREFGPVRGLRQWRWNRQHFGTRRLPSGLQVPVENFSDWIIYRELFELGQYDAAIDTLLRETPPERPIVVMDLGANVGYFIFRFVALLQQSLHPDRDYTICAIEGEPETFAELQRRMRMQTSFRFRVQAHHGLVGRRSGIGTLTAGADHFASKMSCDSQGRRSDIAYLDLATLNPSLGKIDLLKCDIEGSEDEFVQNYPDLLQRVDRICIEMHGCEKRDICLKALTSAGFAHSRLLDEEGAGLDVRFVYLLTRQSASVDLPGKESS